jgi:hypothetical protein
MKKLLLASLFIISLISCKKEALSDIQTSVNPAPSAIAGKWNRTVRYISLQTNTGPKVDSVKTKSEINFIDDTHITITETAANTYTYIFNPSVDHASYFNYSQTKYYFKVTSPSKITATTQVIISDKIYDYTDLYVRQ